MTTFRPVFKLDITANDCHCCNSKIKQNEDEESNLCCCLAIHRYLKVKKTKFKENRSQKHTKRYSI